MKIALVIWPKAYHYIGLAEMVLEPVSSPTSFPPRAVIRERQGEDCTTSVSLRIRFTCQVTENN